jgi:predicted RNase H-like nuclease (RuvC/YqgF family)
MAKQQQGTLSKPALDFTSSWHANSEDQVSNLHSVINEPTSLKEEIKELKEELKQTQEAIKELKEELKQTQEGNKKTQRTRRTYTRRKQKTQSRQGFKESSHTKGSTTNRLR